MRGITTRLHWTDRPCRWHLNDGEEVFAVLDGRVDTLYREGGAELVVGLDAGDVFFAGAADVDAMAADDGKVVGFAGLG